MLKTAKQEINEISMMLTQKYSLFEVKEIKILNLNLTINEIFFNIVTTLFTAYN